MMLRTDGEIQDVVVRALSIELKRPESAVSQSMSLKSDFQMDSIAAVNVAFMIEDALSIEIRLEDDDTFDTVRAIVDVVRRAIHEA